MQYDTTNCTGIRPGLTHDPLTLLDFDMQVWPDNCKRFCHRRPGLCTAVLPDMDWCKMTYRVACKFVL